MYRFVVTLSLMSNADHEVGEKRHAASDAMDARDGDQDVATASDSEAASVSAPRPSLVHLPEGVTPIMLRHYILDGIDLNNIDGSVNKKLVLKMRSNRVLTEFANMTLVRGKYQLRLSILGYVVALGAYEIAEDGAKILAIARLKVEADNFVQNYNVFVADRHTERDRLIARKQAKAESADLTKEDKAERAAAAAVLREQAKAESAVLRKQASDADYAARLDRDTQRRAERKDLEAERKLMKAAEEESKRAERTALKAAEREERFMEFGPRVAERAVATYGGRTRTDVFTHPLYWIEASTIDELNRVMQRFLDIVFRRNFSILPIASKAQRESCATLLTKRLEVPELECVTVAKSIFLLLSPNSTDSEESFILHGLVQTRGHDVARDHLNATARRYLGNSVEVFGLTWRFITFKMGDITPQGNTAPHYDTFSGYQLLISFTLEGTFTLQITKGTKVIAFGPQEQASQIQVMVMAGAHSHERILNPCKLLHSGIPSQGCKRLLLRMSLKGVPDEGILENCDFLELAKAMATLKASGTWNQRLKFMRAG